ncbi:acid-soluble spore protein P [compost metagenome]
MHDTKSMNELSKGGELVTKPKTYMTPGTQPNTNDRRDRHKNGQEPLSGSKKVKNRNHVDHNNPQG